MLIAICGCGKPTPPHFADRLKAYPTPPTNAAFDRLMQAADMIEKSCAQYLGKSELTVTEKRRAIAAAEPAIEHIRTALTPIPEYVYVPVGPLQPSKHRRGWAFLGSVLMWKAHDQISSDNVDAACETVALAIRFGTAISGGDAFDMNLGFTIVSDSAGELWDRLFAASPSALRGLYSQILVALKSGPEIAHSLRSESTNMLAVVNAYQDAFQKNELAQFSEALGQQYRPAFEYLDKLRSESPAEQVEYFDSFAGRAELISNQVSKATSQATHLWEEQQFEKPDAPWWRLADVYFSQAAKMPGWYLKNQSLLRILGVRAALTARLRSGQALPSTIARLPAIIRTDVYSGKDLMYHSQGSDFKLYSVGPDRRDDGGEGGPTGVSPDLVFGR